MAWALFTLDSLVDNWGKNYMVCTNTNAGDFDDTGDYKPPSNDWKTDFGVIAPMSVELFGPMDMGTYTAQDMYCITRSKYQIGNMIKDGSKVYKVHENMDFSDFDDTGLNAYKIKRQGRLDKSDE